MYVPSYKRFGKRREGIKGKRGEGDRGGFFLASEPILDDVTITEKVKCNQTKWLRLRIRKWGGFI